MARAGATGPGLELRLGLGLGLVAQRLSHTCGEDVARVLGVLPPRHPLLEPLAIEDHPGAAWPREDEQEEASAQASASTHH